MMKIGVIPDSFQVPFKEAVVLARDLGVQGLQPFVTGGEMAPEIGDLSLVAGLPEFYSAIETLLAEGLVDSLCVGLMTCLYPTVDLAPFRELLDRYPGKKLYGKIDGWIPNHGGLNQMPLPRPADCAAQVRDYSRAGADGVFFYQSEQILIDPFLERFVRSLKA